MVLHCTAGVPARISSTWMFAMMDSKQAGTGYCRSGSRDAEDN